MKRTTDEEQPLGRYNAMRDFGTTKEPSGKLRPTTGGNSYVIQKHAATALHFDFRLELDGVLLSWAVPKGPSLSTKERRLAVQTEDHPVEYRDFEGTIPKGEYGGGAVIVWDRGTWEPIGDPREGMKKGKLELIVHGEKLRGKFRFVRLAAKDGDRGKKNWLLMKGTDEHARPHTGISSGSTSSGSKKNARPYQWWYSLAGSSSTVTATYVLPSKS